MLKFLASILGLIAGGALMSFAHPFQWEDFVRENSVWNFLIASLGLILMIPLSLKPRTAGRRFFSALTAGSIFFGITLYWLVLAMKNFGGIQLWLSILIAFSLVVYCSSFLGLWAVWAGSTFVRDLPPLRRSLAWASLWTALEVVRQHLFTGFHWGEIGYHFHYLPWIRESASIWGAHGLTFLWVFLISALIHINQFQSEERDRKALFALLGFFMLIVVGAKFSTKLYHFDRELRVALVQPNVEQDDKWNPTAAQRIAKDLVRMTEDAAQNGAELVVWPETAYPRMVGAQQKQLPLSSKVPLLVGAVVRDGSVNRNSALLVQGDQILQRFDKVHLVPFGEFVPFKKWLPFEKLVANVGDFESGLKDQELLRVNGVALGPLICFEDIFNRSAAALSRQKTQLLVNMTNDAWYGHSSAQSQHAAMSAFAVYQTFTPIVRATNNGQSALISLEGRIDVPNFIETMSLQNLKVQSDPKETFFVWTYPLMEWIWLGIFAIALMWKRNPQTRRIFFRK